VPGVWAAIHELHLSERMGFGLDVRKLQPPLEATASVGLGNLLSHDLRRSACRGLLQSGVPQAVCMKITGHRTDSVFRRYAIVTTDDQAEAFERMAA